MFGLDNFVTLLYNHHRQIDAWAVDRYELNRRASGWSPRFVFPVDDVFFTYLRICEFILGCIVAQLYVQLQDKSPSDRECFVARILLVIGVITVPILTFLMYSPNGHLEFVRKLNYNFGLAPSVALILFWPRRAMRVCYLAF